MTVTTTSMSGWPVAAPKRVTEVSVGLSRDKYHRYRWAGGEPMPGTTSILRLQEALSGGDGLTKWAATTAVDKLIALGGTALVREQAIAAITEARETGDEIHAAFDALLGGEPLPPTERAMPYYYGIAGFLAKERPEILGREQTVVNLTHRFGGTFDLAAIVRGECALIDAKTGKGKPSHRLQLASYASAEFIGRPDDPTKYPLPDFTAYYVLLLRPDGYDLVPVQVGDKERDHFLYLAEAYHRLKAYDKELAA
jgi:hypothetical protein